MGLFSAFRRRSSSPQMPSEDIAVIEAYAAGDESKFHEAIDAHRRNISSVGVRGNAHQAFMAEVDNPCPDVALRATYRSQILGAAEEPTPPSP